MRTQITILKKVCFAVMLSFLVIYSTFSQTPQWENYTNGENVTAITEQGGYSWIGTQGGLVRLDKSTGVITHFNKTNSDLKDNFITAITKDNIGNIWIGTRQGGLAKYDGSQFSTYYPMIHNYPHSEITSVLYDNNNLIWVGVFNGGFASSADGNTWTIYNSFNYPNAPSQINQVRSMAFDGAGNLWIGGPSSIVKVTDLTGLTNTVVYNNTNVPGLPNLTVGDIKVAGSNIWFAIGADFNANGVLAKYDGNQFTTWNTSGGLPNATVRRLYFDQNGLLWIGTQGGLCTFDGTSFSTLITTNNGLPDNRITSLLIDSSNEIWVGAYWVNGGLARNSQGSWQSVNTSSSGIPDNSVGAILNASNGYVWVGTESGVAQFDWVNWIIYDFANTGLDLSMITSMAEDGQGTIWIGKQSTSSLFSYDGVWTTYNQGTPIAGKMIYDIFIDQAGKKWVATNNGIVTLDNLGNWAVYNTSDGLPANFVWTIEQDINGNIWAGTVGGGIAYRDNNGNWSSHTYNSLLPSNNVRDIALQGSLVWVATDNGLVKFDGTSHTVYNTQNGLPHNTLRSIAIDANGHIWVGTFGGGIARFDNSSWTTYNMFNSGIPDNSFRKIVIDNSDNIWLGSLRGGMSVLNLGGNAFLNLNFNPGYTWFSVNVNRSNMSPDALLPGIYPCTSDEIIGASLHSSFNGSWSGTLNTLEAKDMYKLNLCSSRQQLIQGNPAPIVPIKLNPNPAWNWIGYLPQQCININTALAGLTPTPLLGDYIMGQNDFATFDGAQWVGSLTQLCPGKGYKMLVSQPSTLTYPNAKYSKVEELLKNKNLATNKSGIQPGRNYQHAMPLIAKLMTTNNRQLNNGDDILYAFVGNECIGAGSMDANLGGLVLMNIGQNDSNPRFVRFKLWSDNLQQLIPIIDSIVFEPLRLAGSLQSPEILIISDPTSTVELLSENVTIGNVWPNPSSDAFNLSVNSYSNANAQVHIGDLVGRTLKHTNHKINNGANYIMITTDGLKPGIYLLTTTVTNDKGQHRKTQKVIIQ